MDLATILPWIQIVLSVILVALVLLQQSEAGLGSAFGGSGGGDGIARTRRGAEKFIFQATIVVGILFAASALLAVVLG